MANAQSYAQWKQAAEELDRIEGKDKWREDDDSPKYDAALLREQMREMQTYRKNQQVGELIELLHESMHRHLGDFNSPGLYRKAWSGSKHIIETYLDEVVESLCYLCEGKFDGLSNAHKLALLRQTERNFGHSAMVFSGGGALGMFHFGVAKVLWQEGLLPNVISGASMGALVTAILGTHTDEELDEFFSNPIRGKSKPFKFNSLQEILNSGSLFDSKVMYELMEAHVGLFTFREAYDRTGRIININVSPTRAHQKPRVLNYMTAPNLVIAHSAHASCSVPGLYPPATLMKKESNGQITPYIPEDKWIDGSFFSDVPLRRLTRLHNVNHFIVSQTNPHIVPFINASRKPGIVPYVTDLAGSAFFNQAVSLLDVTRRHVYSYPIRPILENIYSFASQKFSGDINIRPDFSTMDYIKVFKNLNNEEKDKYIRQGELATYPKISKIKNQTIVGKTFAECLHFLELNQDG